MEATKGSSREEDREAAEARARVSARLAALDEATQAHIARKYYGGKRPWRGKQGRPARG